MPAGCLQQLCVQVPPAACYWQVLAGYYWCPQVPLLRVYISSSRALYGMPYATFSSMVSFTAAATSLSAVAAASMGPSSAVAVTSIPLLPSSSQ
ncbi:MAG: hypothetical protein NTY03_08545 [Candidatus Bathyarchaeota archaeon]|nr:hypothetical protein [Candidatus Bathyarchaeota archaeon]